MKILPVRLLVLLLVAVPLSGCAVTQSAIHSAGKAPPLCQVQTNQESALVLWGTAWRTDQKEMKLREEKASQAITQFFGSRPCYAKTTLLRKLAGHEPLTLSDIEIIDFASTLPDHYNKIILLRVEELGPLLIFYLSPILWEGGSEAVVRVRVLDVNSGSLESDVNMHRRNTGAFVLRGTKRLEEDLEAALGQVFFGTIK
jgi:hypothetical protein